MSQFGLIGDGQTAGSLSPLKIDFPFPMRGPIDADDLKVLGIDPQFGQRVRDNTLTDQDRRKIQAARQRQSAILDPLRTVAQKQITAEHIRKLAKEEREMLLASIPEESRFELLDLSFRPINCNRSTIRKLAPYLRTTIRAQNPVRDDPPILPASFEIMLRQIKEQEEVKEVLPPGHFRPTLEFGKSGPRIFASDTHEDIMAKTSAAKMTSGPTTQIDDKVLSEIQRRLDREFRKPADVLKARVAAVYDEVESAFPHLLEKAGKESMLNRMVQIPNPANRNAEAIVIGYIMTIFDEGAVGNAEVMLKRFGIHQYDAIRYARMWNDVLRLSPPPMPLENEPFAEDLEDDDDGDIQFNDGEFDFPEFEE